MSEEELKLPDDLTLISPDEFRRAAWGKDGTRFLISVMVRLGFWPEDVTMDELDPPEESARIKEIPERN